MHITNQMFITTPDAHCKTRCYTNSSRGNKVGLLQQITKNKTATCSDFGHFCMFIKMDCNKEKRNSVSNRGKMGETILIQWECSNVLHHFIDYFF